MCRCLRKDTGITTNQGDMTLPKEYIKPPVTGPKEMKIQEAPNKEFKIIVLNMLRELEENTEKQFNDIRKIKKILPHII